MIINSTAMDYLIVIENKSVGVGYKIKQKYETIWANYQ